LGFAELRSARSAAKESPKSRAEDGEREGAVGPHPAAASGGKGRDGEEGEGGWRRRWRRAAAVETGPLAPGTIARSVGRRERESEERERGGGEKKKQKLLYIFVFLDSNEKWEKQRRSGEANQIREKRLQAKIGSKKSGPVNVRSDNGETLERRGQGFYARSRRS
jgi:hypothetical protein